MQGLQAGGAGAFQVLGYVVDKQCLLGDEVLIGEDAVESFGRWLAAMYKMREIGGIETLLEYVEAIFCTETFGETIVVDLVGVAEEECIIPLAQAYKQLDTFGRDVYEYGVDDVINVTVAKIVPGHCADIVAVFGRGEEAFLELIHLRGLKVLAVEAAKVGYAVTYEGLADILVANVVYDAAKIEYDIAYLGCFIMHIVLIINLIRVFCVCIVLQRYDFC